MSEQALVFVSQLSILSGAVIFGSIYGMLALAYIAMTAYEGAARLYREMWIRFQSYLLVKDVSPASMHKKQLPKQQGV